MMPRVHFVPTGALCAAFALLLFGSKAWPQTVTRLSDVHKIYVEKMDRNLDKALRTEIVKTLSRSHSISVVTDRKSADAILVQTKIDPKDVHTITVNLTDAGGIAVLWSGTASDRDLMFGGLKRNGSQKIARHLVKELEKAMQR